MLYPIFVLISFLLTPCEYSVVDNTLDFALKSSFIMMILFNLKHGLTQEAITRLVMSISSLFVVAVLFGVQPFVSFTKTMGWASYLSTLLLPNYLEDIEMSPNDNNYLIICGTLMGSWFGSFVIPLDWATKWQVWPIPNIFMSAVAYLIVTCFLFVKEKIN